jgi:hypothetical protein
VNVNTNSLPARAASTCGDSIFFGLAAESIPRSAKEGPLCYGASVYVPSARTLPLASTTCSVWVPIEIEPPDARPHTSLVDIALAFVHVPSVCWTNPEPPTVLVVSTVPSSFKVIWLAYCRDEGSVTVSVAEMVEEQLIVDGENTMLPDLEPIARYTKAAAATIATTMPPMPSILGVTLRPPTVAMGLPGEAGADAPA